VLPFGYGLHYTTFKLSWCTAPKKTYSISSLVGSSPSGYGHSTSTKNDASPWTDLSLWVGNSGRVASDFVGLLFIKTTAGPKPLPNKWLAAYSRIHGLKPGAAEELQLKLNLGALARANSAGDLVIYPGDYQILIDYDSKIVFNFKLTGQATTIDKLVPQQSSYNYTVPVHPQP
jgi:xylan 1,4-beta-xylosidase